MRYLLLLSTCLFTGASAVACINAYHVKLDGTIGIFDKHMHDKITAKKLAVRDLEDTAMLLKAEYEDTGDYKVYSDYGSVLIYLGKYERAKSVYLEIEQVKPGEYVTASNLGTAYELLGQPDSALYWIERAVQLNPDAHDGSEWVHIAILKYKLLPLGDRPASVLGLGFGEGELPTNPEEYDLQKLKRHIAYQLHERMYFVQPEDPIVGNILFDHGNIVAQTTNVPTALTSYALAKEYEYESGLLAEREAAFVELVDYADYNYYKEQVGGLLSIRIVGIPFWLWAVVITIGGAYGLRWLWRLRY